MQMTDGGGWCVNGTVNCTGDHRLTLDIFMQCTLYCSPHKMSPCTVNYTAAHVRCPHELYIVLQSTRDVPMHC